MQKNSNQAEMVEPEGSQAIVNQTAIQVVTAVMMEPRDIDAGAQPAATAGL